MESSSEHFKLRRSYRVNFQKWSEYQIIHKSGSWSDYQIITKSGSWSEYELSPSLFGLLCHNTINKIINFKEEKDTRQNTCFKILENSKQAEH
jgi:hypothetical protein